MRNSTFGFCFRIAERTFAHAALTIASRSISILSIPGLSILKILESRTSVMEDFYGHFVSARSEKPI